jgi:protein TonB
MPDPFKQRFDRRSPVQPHRSPAPYFVAAIIVAVASWAIQQRAVENSNPERTSYPTRGDVRALFSSDDYPADAQQNGEEGSVRARLTVDARGRVAKCTIIRSSGHVSLDKATCDVLRDRARFSPARDANGKAVSDSFVTPLVVWRLEG